MELPTQPIRLDAAEIEDLARHFSAFRHDVNGCLSLVVAATELIRYNPDVVKRMSATLIEQPPRIAGKTYEFARQCERALKLVPVGEPSWYLELWKRYNAAPGEAPQPVTVAPEVAKALHTEVLQLGKELLQLSFVVSGVKAISVADPSSSPEASAGAVDQLSKAAKRFGQLAELLEKSLQLNAPSPKRLASGAPAGPVELTPEQVTLLHRRIGNLERDVVEHLRPLVELSRLARTDTKQVQARAAEFAGQPPKISTVISEFATEFDQTFHIVRANA